MGLAGKLAKFISKPEKPKPSEKRQMVEKTNKELEEIVSKTTGDSKKGTAARNELTRREERKSFKKGEPTWEGETLKDSEAPKYKKGGMVKALAKKPAKKLAVKKLTKKGI
jgi:hypothetical protein